MPNKLFYELDEKKKTRIKNVLLKEFAQYSFSESSTNRIVKNAGIGKGSLFKYFQNKKEMYFYILDYTTAELTGILETEIANLPEDLFKRTIKYAELEFNWYINNPEKYEFLDKAFAQNDTEIFIETEKRYNLKGEEFFYKIFEDVNPKQFKWEKAKLLNILKWFLKGFNESFVKEIQVEDIEDLKEVYLKRLFEYMEILQQGLK